MKSCTFEGCGLPHVARGLCNGHYSQRSRGVDLKPLVRPTVGCLFPACDGRHKGKGYCEIHLKQLREGKELKPVVRRMIMNHPDTCTVEGCSKPYKAIGLCAAHQKAKWNAENPEKTRAYVHTRRGYLANAGRFEPYSEKFLRNVYGAKCIYPGCAETENLQVDHIVPLSKGGSNHVANLQLLCQYHNLSKHNRDQTDYRPSLLSPETSARIRAAL